jgi:hypothetical protein
MTRTGHCLCGAVSFAYDGPENWRGYCHCDSCRRATGSPVTAFMGVPHGHWRWTGAEPVAYASSPGVTRRFCPTCGSPVSYQSLDQPDEIHFYAALLDDPADFAPDAHFHYDEHLPWLQITDGLKKKPA